MYIKKFLDSTLYFRMCECIKKLGKFLEIKLDNYDNKIFKWYRFTMYQNYICQKSSRAS